MSVDWNLVLAIALSVGAGIYLAFFAISALLGLLGLLIPEDPSTLASSHAPCLFVGIGASLLFVFGLASLVALAQGGMLAVLIAAGALALLALFSWGTALAVGGWRDLGSAAEGSLIIVFVLGCVAAAVAALFLL